MTAAKWSFLAGLALIFAVSVAEISAEEGCSELQQLATKEAARAGSCLQRSASSAQVAQVNAPVPPKLLLHIGPFKTGSTSVQELLIQANNSWLAHHAKAVSFLKHKTTGWNSGISHADFEGLPKILRHSKKHQLTTIVSCEGFSSWKEDEWKKFKSRSFAKSAKVQVAMVYRAPWDRLVSIWLEAIKHSYNPPSFDLQKMVDSYVREDHENPDAGCPRCNRYQVFNDLRMYKKMVNAFGRENVNVVSYDLLREEHIEYSAYLLCNVTQHLSGYSWQACNATITERMQKELDNSCDGGCNISPTPAAIDVVQLAREMHKEHCKHQEFHVTAQDQATQEIAELMPQVCVHFDEIEQLREEYETFFLETGITKPSSIPSKEQCWVNRVKLTDSHRHLIQKKLLPHCF